MTNREPPKLKPAPCCILCCYHALNWCEEFNRKVTEWMVCDCYRPNTILVEEAQNECDQP